MVSASKLNDCHCSVIWKWLLPFCRKSSCILTHINRSEDSSGRNELLALQNEPLRQSIQWRASLVTFKCCLRIPNQKYLSERWCQSRTKFDWFHQKYIRVRLSRNITHPLKMDMMTAKSPPPYSKQCFSKYDPSQLKDTSNLGQFKFWGPIHTNQVSEGGLGLHF